MTANVGEIATLAHGYTMAEIDSMTRRASGRGADSSAMSMSERLETAWLAMVEVLYESEDRPPEWLLVNTGKDAIRNAIRDQMHHHGIRGQQAAPRFAAYWLSVAKDSENDFTDKLTERMALPQILGQLTDQEYEAIATLAIYGKRAPAALALGISVVTFKRRLASARKKAIALWLEHETPRSAFDAEKSQLHCRSGHPRDREGFKIVRKGRESWSCRACNAQSQRRKRVYPGLLVQKSLESELESKAKSLAQTHGATPATVHRHAS